MSPEFVGVYIIYSADVVADSAAFIEFMAPANKSPELAQHFTETEGDDQYDYGYLADEGCDKRYLAYADRESEDDPNAGMHRKWVAELTIDQWRKFADDYSIDLRPNGFPTDYTDTMGSITEHGLIDAVAVDNTEGWDDNHGNVIDSSMYVSFALQA
jgi:hypothetical protein